MQVACSLSLLLTACGDEQVATRLVGSEAAESAQHKLHANAEPPVDCEACHEKVQDRYLRATSWKCETCHSEARLVLHKAASEESGARECWSCHDFTAVDARPTDCSACHSKAQDSVPAIVPHDPQAEREDCGECHRAHEEPSLQSVDCSGCHRDEQVSGHTAPDIPIRDCGSCHGYHEQVATASKRCTNCHRQSRALVSVNATFANGHEKCVTCHQSHQFEKQQVLGCRDRCHQDVVALAEDKVKDHRGCIGCHNKHDVRGELEDSCQRCHKALTPRHPRDAKSKTRCLGCHKPHGGREAPLAVACSSCHNQATSERGLHQGRDHRGPACRNCHQPHRFALKGSGVQLCRTCHTGGAFANAAAIRTHDKHGDCFACHGDTVAHQPSGRRAACTSCHKEKAKGVHEKHQNCVQCHDPHTTEQRKACGQCHDQQAQSAPEKHRECTNCHEPHSTAVGRECASCHAERATGIHRAVSGGCTSCHRPHGPGGHASPPACKSCHRDELPGLHGVADHADCTACHRSHGAQPHQKTTTCLGCHKDRKKHEPDASTCIGCHPFGGAQ